MIPALAIEGVSKTFGGVRAVSDVTFTVGSGTATAIIGPNGAGKTTLFNIITNLLPATAGVVHLHGRAITGLSVEAVAALGLVRTFQTARVFPGMTVLENVCVGAHRLLRRGPFAQMLTTPAARGEERAVRARALALLEIVGLARDRDRAASDLPMGAQKILEAVRALMATPSVLLLDEPAAGLNDTETGELSAMLAAIRATGVTLVVVEHNMSLVMGLADQIVVIDAGRTVAVGPPATIRRDQAVIDAYVGREATHA